MIGGLTLNLLSLLWKERQREKCNLYDISYSNNEVEVLLKEEGFEESVKSNSCLLLVNRYTKERKEFTLKHKMVGNVNVFFVKLSLDEIQSLFATFNEVWDAYYLKKTNKKITNVRIKNINNEYNKYPIYNSDINRETIFYSTVKGNLSIKIEESNPEFLVNNIILSKNGTAFIEGTFSLSYIKLENLNISKDIFMKDGLNFEVLGELLLDKEDGVLTSTSFKKTSFKFDLKRVVNNVKKGIPIPMYLKVSDDETIRYIPIKHHEIFNEKASFYLENKIQEISLKAKSPDFGINMEVLNDDIQVEVSEIYPIGNQIELKGKLLNTSSELIHMMKNPQIFFVKREKPACFIQYPVLINNNHTFHFVLDVDDINLNFEEDLYGIFDVYLILSGIKYRLTNRSDGIVNKQKIINLPQILQPNNSGNLMAIKPYYTINNEFSILIRDVIHLKKIDSVSILKDGIRFEGKLNIQPPNKDVSDICQGQLKFKGDFGRVFECPVEWTFEKTEKTPLEFAFKTEMKFNDSFISPDNTIEVITTNAIECKVLFCNHHSTFQMVVDPLKIYKYKDDKSEKPLFLKKLETKLIENSYRMFNKLLPIKENTIIFQSFHGKSYSCNPKAIYKYMKEHDIDMNFVWVLNNQYKKIEGNPQIVKPKSLKYYYYMARAKYFVNNGNFPDFYNKRKGAVHIQTWHGTPLKKLGFDIDISSPSYKENTSPALMRRNKRWDYLIGPNDYTSEILKRAFKYEGKMLDIGYPRNDIFYNYKEDVITELKNRLGIPISKKVILYAPTWRDYEFHNGRPEENFNVKFDIERFKSEFGEDYVLLLRLHYRDANRLKINVNNNVVLNVSNYDDIQELYLISDILITDYSSVMFDYANLNRPILFYAYDYKRYSSELRGFYLNFKEEAPGPIITSEARLFQEIRNIDQVKNRYASRYKRFQEKFCHLDDGEASKRVINTVFKSG